MLTLEFTGSPAGIFGPFAMQTPKADLFDEYKNIIIELNPVVDDLVTIRDEE